MKTVDELVTLHAAWIRERAYRYYRNPADADDLAGETIYKCLSSRRLFDSARAFKPWVAAIMENTFIIQYNRRRCVLFTGINSCDSCLGYEYTDQRVTLSHIISIVRRYARKTCNIDCVLMYAKGYSYEEIAHNMGIPVGTVRSRIANGRKILAKALEV